VGQPLEIVVNEGGRERTLRVSPRDTPSLTAERVSALRYLFELVTVTPAIRGERRLASPDGALITSVAEDARGLGLRPGDVIVEINRARVRSAEQAAQILSQLASRPGYISITYERHGQYSGVDIRLR
jgi:type II secretory pathway component PulC